MDALAPQVNWRQAATMMAVLALAFFLADFPAISQAQGSRDGPPPSEHQVKAAFLLNFTKFIDWPPGAAGSDNPFAICVVGDDPFGTVLDQTVEGERAAGRNIVVRRVREPAASCDLLFFARSARGVQRALAGVRRGVLTVGETGDFLRQGGMISFVVEDRRVRFDVDERAAVRSGLKISSRLLNVARSVER